MPLFLSHETAVRYWLTTARLANPAHPLAISAFENTVTQSREIRLLQTSSVGLFSHDKTLHEAIVRTGPPLDVLVPANRNCRRIDGVRFHVHKGSVPPHSFCRIADSLYVTSPELTFLQMAQSLTPVDTMLLGLDLCGAYMLDPRSQRGTSPCKPATNIAAVKRFLSYAKGCRGMKRAISAVSRIADNARSPRESQLFLAYSLAPLYGGFSVPSLGLAKRVDPIGSARFPSGRTYYECDLYLPGGPMDIEYQGKVDHEGYSSMSDDAARANDLQAQGVQCLFVTNQQVHNLALLTSTARAVYRACGKRWREPDAELLRKRESLRRALFERPWGIAYGLAPFTSHNSRRGTVLGRHDEHSPGR